MTKPLTALLAEAGERITRAVNAKVIPPRWMNLASDLHRAAHEIDEHMRDEMEAAWIVRDDA